MFICMYDIAVNIVNVYYYYIGSPIRNTLLHVRRNLEILARRRYCIFFLVLLSSSFLYAWRQFVSGLCLRCFVGDVDVMMHYNY